MENVNVDRRMELLNLPILAFENMYRFLDFVDLINLAECSKRMKTYVKRVENSKRNTTTCQVSIRQTRRMITIKRQDRDNFSWSSHSPRNYYTANAVDFIERKVDGRIWRVSPWRYGWMTLGINDDDLLFWANYLKEMFNFKITDVELELQTNVDFQKLFVDTDIFRTATDKFSIHQTSIHAHEMDFILDNFNAEDMALMAQPKMTYIYEKPITRFPKITMIMSTWLSLQDLWLMADSCKLINLDLIECGAEDLNQLLKNWLASDNKTLNYLKFRHPDNVFMEHTTVFDGIESTPGREKRREAAVGYYRSDIRYEDGRDIKRSDGLLATLWTKEDRHSIIRGVHFTVWYDPNPNKVYANEE